MGPFIYASRGAKGADRSPSQPIDYSQAYNLTFQVLFRCRHLLLVRPVEALRLNEDFELPTYALMPVCPHVIRTRIPRKMGPCANAAGILC